MADETATGTTPVGKQGVPVVDLDQLVADLRDHAARHRRAAERVMEAAWHQHKSLHNAADYLTSLATTLEGANP